VTGRVVGIAGWAGRGTAPARASPYGLINVSGGRHFCTGVGAGRRLDGLNACGSVYAEGRGWAWLSTSVHGMACGPEREPLVSCSLLLSTKHLWRALLYVPFLADRVGRFIQERFWIGFAPAWFWFAARFSGLDIAAALPLRAVRLRSALGAVYQRHSGVSSPLSSCNIFCRAWLPSSRCLHACCSLLVARFLRTSPCRAWAPVAAGCRALDGWWISCNLACISVGSSAMPALLSLPG